MLCNIASGWRSGLRAGSRKAGFQAGKPQSRPAGRPSAGRTDDFDAFPTRIRPKFGPEASCSGPEALLRNIVYFLETQASRTGRAYRVTNCFWVASCYYRVPTLCYPVTDFCHQVATFYYVWLPRPRRRHLEKINPPTLNNSVALESLTFVDFRSLSGQTWPGDPLQRIRHEEWFIMRSRSAPWTNSTPIRDHFMARPPTTRISHILLCDSK